MVWEADGDHGRNNVCTAWTLVRPTKGVKLVADICTVSMQFVWHKFCHQHRIETLVVDLPLVCTPIYCGHST